MFATTVFVLFCVQHHKLNTVLIRKEGNPKFKITLLEKVIHKKFTTYLKSVYNKDINFPLMLCLKLVVFLSCFTVVASQFLHLATLSFPSVPLSSPLSLRCFLYSQLLPNQLSSVPSKKSGIQHSPLAARSGFIHSHALLIQRQTDVAPGCFIFLVGSAYACLPRAILNTNTLNSL